LPLRRPPRPPPSPSTTLFRSEGGDTGPVNDLLRATFERTGATVIGRRMFDAGAEGWPEEAPFHTDDFVVTHRPQEPWKRLGGTTDRKSTRLNSSHVKISYAVF